MTKSYTRDGLGQTIERCRVQKGLTQQQLGELAGYQAGAAVSISRVESGNVLPGQARLAGIAAALELSLVDLESAATERTREIETGKVPAGSAALAARRADDLAQWAKRLEQQAQHRAAVHSEVIEAFTDAYDRSLIQFFLPLVEVSSDFGGLDRAAESSRSRERTLPEEEAAFRFRVARSGVASVAAGGAQFAAIGASREVGQLAAYGTLRAVVSLGKAGTGRRISDLHGAPQLRAATARIGGGPKAMGGGGIVAGQRRLNGIASGVGWGLPILVSVVAETRRLKKLQRLTEELNQFEASFKATERGYQAVAELLPRATAVLDDIAVHGARALTRWIAQMGQVPGGAHRPADERRYREFVELSTCQVVAGAIDVDELLEQTGDALEELIASIDEAINRAQSTVAKLV